jgi:hypothetical protein
MSGTVLATFSAAVEAVNAIGRLAFGATGGVVLGDFVFAGFEVPEQITFGGKQAMTVHKLPGGERVVDLMGPDEGAIEWSGTFISDEFDPTDPALRAQQLDQMRAAGNPLPLVWGQFYYTVLISDFTADTRYSMVPYKISCLVLRNEATAPPEDASSVDLTGATTSDMGSALDVAPADAQAALTTAETALAAVGSISPAGASTVTALAAVTQANNTLLALRTSNEASVNTIVANAGTDLVASSTDLTDAVAYTGELAQLTAAQGYLGRMWVNLGGSPWQ